MLQTLRARLTTVEGKLVEKEFEIKRLMEENDSLKETVENLSRLTVGKSDGEFIKHVSVLDQNLGFWKQTCELNCSNE